MKTLQKILEEFDEKFDHDSPVGKALVLIEEQSQRPIAKELKQFITTSIKDALEACRVKQIAGDRETYMQDRKFTYEEIKSVSESMLIDQGWNANTTQYDDNVKYFLQGK